VHEASARRLAATGKLDQALVEYELALELNPTASELETALRDVRAQLRTKVAVAREGKTELQTLIERARDTPPAGLELPANVQMPTSLVFRDAGSRDVFLAFARLANLSITFDPTFRSTPLTVDLRNASLESAFRTVSEASQNFYRVTGARTVLIIPDTPNKRREYEEEVVRTFYLSNADLKETMDLLRMVLDARRVSPVTATNAVTVKDTPERIAAAARVISAIDKARPEVIIDVELLEVDRTKLAEYGLQIA
jgi:general secretion pathway protein D